MNFLYFLLGFCCGGAAAFFVFVGLLRAAHEAKQQAALDNKADEFHP